MTIDRILFATRRDNQWQKGFPLRATFFTSQDGEEYEEFSTGVAELKNNVVAYTFDKPFTAKYFKFEYTEIYSGTTQHASASELIFLRPEEEIIDRVKGMFSDYMQTKLLPEFNDRETILSLEEQLSGHPLYEGNLYRYIQRALSVLDGTLMTDVVNRQFTTDPTARGNFIQQRGDIFAYGQDLHFMFGLSNYMPTGIYGNTGEQITIYVEADEGQPLPKVAFTQFLTTYQYWQGSKIELQRGEVPERHNRPCRILQGKPRHGVQYSRDNVRPHTCDCTGDARRRDIRKRRHERGRNGDKFMGRRQYPVLLRLLVYKGYGKRQGRRNIRSRQQYHNRDHRKVHILGQLHLGRKRRRTVHRRALHD